MRPELAARAARHLVEASGDRESVTLVLFGGEPLLNLPALKAAVLEGEAAAATRGKKLVVSITTNGTRFTPEALDFLGGASRSACRSASTAHRTCTTRTAATRAPTAAAPTPTSSTGWQRLRERTRQASGGAGDARRRTSGRACPRSFDHVLGLGFLEVGIAPTSPVTAKLLPTPEQDEALFAGFSRSRSDFAPRPTQGRVLPFSNLLDLLGQLHLGQVKAAPCGAGPRIPRDGRGRPLLPVPPLAGGSGSASAISTRGIDHAKIRGVPRRAGGPARGRVRVVLGAQPLRRRLPLREPPARVRSRAFRPAGPAISSGAGSSSASASTPTFAAIPTIPCSPSSARRADG